MTKETRDTHAHVLRVVVAFTSVFSVIFLYFSCATNDFIRANFDYNNAGPWKPNEKLPTNATNLKCVTFEAVSSSPSLFLQWL